MDNKELNITWCYPDLLNLHGDRGNLMALDKVSKLMGLKVNIQKIENLNDSIDFEHTDILFFNTGELRMVKPIVESLQSNKEALTNYIESGKTIIVIGTSGAIFAKEVQRLTETFSGLGYLDMTCKERDTIYGDDLIYTLADDSSLQLNGSQIQVIDTTLHQDIALGTIYYGRGNNGDSKHEEGAKYKSLYFTNCLGPVFIKNPWFTGKIIREAMAQKEVTNLPTVEPSLYDIEQKSMECIIKYNDKKIKS